MWLVLQIFSKLPVTSSVKWPLVVMFSGSLAAHLNLARASVFSLQEAMPVSLSPAACYVSLRLTTAEAAGVQKV